MKQSSWALLGWSPERCRQRSQLSAPTREKEPLWPAPDHTETLSYRQSDSAPQDLFYG